MARWRDGRPTGNQIAATARDGRWLRGNEHRHTILPAADLSSALRLFHTQGRGRPVARQRADRDYRRWRTLSRIER